MNRLIIVILLLANIVVGSHSLAQTQIPPPSLIGTWEGPLSMGRDSWDFSFTFAMKDGNYTAALYIADLGIYGLPADTVKVDGLNLLIQIPRLDLDFTASLRLDEEQKSIIRIDGDWFQRSEMVPVVLLPVANPSL